MRAISAHWRCVIKLGKPFIVVLLSFWQTKDAAMKGFWQIKPRIWVYKRRGLKIYLFSSLNPNRHREKSSAEKLNFFVVRGIQSLTKLRERCA
jgi:hypothetical protein